MVTQTLLLDARFLPHAILGWEDAICLVYQDKATVLEEYDVTVSSPSVTYFVPAVLRLQTVFAPVKKGVKFSRANVFVRDGYRCQYCGERRAPRELNFDHVLPRRQGGRTTWENIVACCYPCNEQKGGRTPEQAGMRLLRRPAKPHSLPLHAVFVRGAEIPSPWLPYLDLSRVHRHEGGWFLVGSAA